MQPSESGLATDSQPNSKPNSNPLKKMTHTNTQTPDVPSFNETHPSASTVKPIESKAKPTGNTWIYPDATALKFPMTMSAVADEISRSLKFTCKPNTLKSRWMPDKIMPVFVGLDIPDIKTEKGLITDFGYSVISEAIARCIKGDDGFKIAPETLREEMIERYGMKPVKDTLKGTLDLLERSKQQKEQAEANQESSALALLETKSKGELLIEALLLRNAAKSIKASEKKDILSAEEKVEIFAEEMEREDAVEEFRKQVREGRVTIEDIL